MKKAPEILVGTPGRLLDHLKRKTIKLDGVKTVVLDEADEMLDMGFIQDIESILTYAENRDQTLLFSATMPKPIQALGEKFMHDPQVVKIQAKQLTADLIDQYFVRVRENEKFDTMCRLIDVENPDLAVVFGRTKRRVDELTRAWLPGATTRPASTAHLTQAGGCRCSSASRKGSLTFWWLLT